MCRFVTDKAEVTLFSARSYGGADVLGAFHSALDFRRGNADFFKLADVIYQAVVLQAQGIAVFVFADRKRKSARLGTRSPIAAATAEHCAEIALSRHAHTQCAVNENLKLNGDFGAFSDFFFAHFT